MIDEGNVEIMDEPDRSGVLSIGCHEHVCSRDMEPPAEQLPHQARVVSDQDERSLTGLHPPEASCGRNSGLITLH